MAKTDYQASRYVPRLKEESLANAALADPYRPIVFYGPDGIGKTWLLERLLEVARKDKSNVALRVDLDDLDVSPWAGPVEVEDALVSLVEAAAPGHAKKPRQPHDLASALRDILGKANTLVLAVDGLEVTAGKQMGRHVFGALAQLVDPSSGAGSLQELRLMTATPLLFSARAKGVPAPTLGDEVVIEVRDFDLAQTHQLAAKLGLHPTSSDLETVRGTVGGHPRLLTQIFELANDRGIAPAKVLANAELREKVLQPYRLLLREEPELRDMFSRVRRTAFTSLVGLPEVRRLERKGLVQIEAQKHPRVRYPLLLDLDD